MFAENRESQINSDQERMETLLTGYDELKGVRAKEKEVLKKLREQLNITESENTSVEKNDTPEYAEHIKEVVTKMQHLFIEGAENYLPEHSSLREDIVAFYADPERLHTELSNIYKGFDAATIDERVTYDEAYFKDKDRFLQYVITKDFSLAG